MSSGWFRVGAYLGALAIATGAFGAHALKNNVADLKLLEYWNTAAHYHLIHSLAIIISAQAGATGAAWAFTIGIALFSGSLYTMTLTNARWLGAITPIGGTSMIIGWIMLGSASDSVLSAYKRLD